MYTFCKIIGLVYKLFPSCSVCFGAAKYILFNMKRKIRDGCAFLIAAVGPAGLGSSQVVSFPPWWVLQRHRTIQGGLQLGDGSTRLSWLLVFCLFRRLVSSFCFADAQSTLLCCIGLNNILSSFFGSWGLDISSQIFLAFAGASFSLLGSYSRSVYLPNSLGKEMPFRPVLELSNVHHLSRLALCSLLDFLNLLWRALTSKACLCILIHMSTCTAVCPVCRASWLQMFEQNSQRPHHGKNTGSRPITEVNILFAGLLAGLLLAQTMWPIPHCRSKTKVGCFLCEE